MRIVKFFKAIFCKHQWKHVDNSSYYFHWKCQKCDSEKGIGNIKIK